MERKSVAIHEERICECCGNSFISGNANQRFCSRKCQKKLNRLKNESPSEGAKVMRQGNRFTSEEGFVARINAKSSRFEYISGDVKDSFVYIMCKDCLGVVRRSKESLKPSRSKILYCPYCQETLNGMADKAKQERRDNYLKTIEEARKAKAEKEKEKELSRHHVCARCGSPFIGKSSRGMYCSELCSRRAHDSAKEHNRRVRMKSKGENISLELLIKRDKGICWICNKATDSNDYMVRESGAFVVGNNYPSIDHVLALSKGGKHTWANVRLAHHICNTRKHAKLFYEEANGQISMFV